MCREAGISPPEFEEITSAAVVTFQISVETTGEVTREVTGVVKRLLARKGKTTSEGNRIPEVEMGKRSFWHLYRSHPLKYDRMAGGMKGALKMIKLFD